MKYKCLLMDMDGLLVDSERITFDMWKVIFERHGYELDLDGYCMMVGKTEQTVTQVLAEHYPGMSLREDIWPEWDGQYEEIAPAGGVPLKDGALELLDWADSHGLSKAIVSSNLKHWVDTILKGDRVHHRFDLLLHGGMAEHGKPAPDLFLLAADTLGFAPEECLVLEDSDAGIESGHNAGMDVICIPDLRHPSDEVAGYCKRIFGSLRDVIPFLEQDL